jgi:hypothetical protein
VAPREGFLTPRTATSEHRTQGLRLFAVVGLEARDGESLAPDTTLVSFRDLGAVVTIGAFTRVRPGVLDVERHREVIDRIFSRRAVLPAPVGVVFRNRDALVRWLELHYLTLTDGLGFVEGRVALRIHVSPRPAVREGEAPVSAGLEGSEIFRVLSHHAAATITLRHSGDDGRVSSSFLIERERLKIFDDILAEETVQHPLVVIEQTGPWPPYDFVKMQFGA